MSEFKMKINGLKKKVRFVESTETLIQGDLLVHCEYNDREYLKTLSKLSNLEPTKAVGDRAGEHPTFTYLRPV
jgi:hypothetical protein